ncbi:hypothetical protein EVAR_50089_1 [Eumeta japonica]|uniref:Uncharacterized protein n=1 Tax=Eumeta variegata TaxID=151549 RepID=A0A4C1XUC2_EUMVA|nr:hypothetical protein EVAR_50089_1 [Eumeta japonica]
MPRRSPEVSPIGHVTRRRHPRVSSGRVRGFQPHNTRVHGRAGVHYAFLFPPRRKRGKISASVVVLLQQPYVKLVLNV